MSQKNYDIAALKSSLLMPQNTALEQEILGCKVYLRRLSAAELLEQEEQVKATFEEGDIRKSSLLNVQLILDCMVTPACERILPEYLPTAEELLAAHDNSALLEAISIVKRHAIGTLEEAKKN